MQFRFEPIGTIHSPFKELTGMPIQPGGGAGLQGHVEILPAYEAGLKDLDGFSHIILIYAFHRAGEARLTVTPFMDTQPRGLFATRAPARPNPIGLSVVELLSVEGRSLHIADLDILDGTPLLDIKPCVPEFDRPEVTRIGWLESARGESRRRRADDRFR